MFTIFIGQVLTEKIVGGKTSNPEYKAYRFNKNTTSGAKRQRLCNNETFPSCPLLNI